MNVDVFITGRMYHLAAAAPDRLDLPADAKLSNALAQLAEALPEPLPASTLVTVGGNHRGSLGQYEDCSLHDGDELMLVAPVAGG